MKRINFVIRSLRNSPTLALSQVLPVRSFHPKANRLARAQYYWAFPTKEASRRRIGQPNFCVRHSHKQLCDQLNFRMNNVVTSLLPSL
jgi:hypothetical protein